MIDRASAKPTRERTADPVSPDAAMVATALTRYPGGKNGAGIYQRLINQMPPHQVYIEAFLGSGAILRRKRPACSNIGIDADANVIARHAAAGPSESLTLIHGDARRWLEVQMGGSGSVWPRETLIYCDPPYLGDARSCGSRAIYQHELTGVDDHAELLRILTAIPAMVMISGYSHPLYDERLRGWRRIDYQAMTRGGLKPEVLWCNFPEPTELHDYRWLGEDFRERNRIARKIARWTRKLAAMPALERAAVITALGAAPHK